MTFDTPTRAQLLESIHTASSNDEDILQIATTPLLSNISLSVCVKDLMGRAFKSMKDSTRVWFHPSGLHYNLEIVLQQMWAEFPTTSSADV